MDINKLKSVISEMNLNDDDLVFGFYMPTKHCDKCGGMAVASWDDNGDSILCDCIYDGVDLMNFGLLKKLLTLNKSEVYNGA